MILTTIEVDTLYLHFRSALLFNISQGLPLSSTDLLVTMKDNFKYDCDAQQQAYVKHWLSRTKEILKRGLVRMKQYDLN
jgi:hypothetical protein